MADKEVHDKTSHGVRELSIIAFIVALILIGLGLLYIAFQADKEMAELHVDVLKSLALVEDILVLDMHPTSAAANLSSPSVYSPRLNPLFH